MHVTVNNIQYDIGKLNALEQLHLMRSVLSVVDLPAAQAAAKTGDGSTSFSDVMDSGAFDGLMSASDETVEGILKKAFKCVKRLDNGVYVNMVSGGVLMYMNDLNISEMFELFGHVMTINLSDALKKNQ